MVHNVSGGREARAWRAGQNLVEEEWTQTSGQVRKNNPAMCCRAGGHNVFCLYRLCVCHWKCGSSRTITASACARIDSGCAGGMYGRNQVRCKKNLKNQINPHTHTHTHVGFCGLWGLSIGVMVFILNKLCVLLPYTYPTPKLSPHRRLCASLDFQKNTI